MHIDRIDLFRVSMPLVYPFRTAYGDEDTIESILVRMTSGDLVGWGETTPWSWPGYCNEWAASAFILLRDWLAPRLLGQEIVTGAQLQAKLSFCKDNPFAKAGLDTAWWDLHARQVGQPLWQLIGGSGPVATVGADFGVMETIDALLTEIERAVDAGFQRVKLKYRPGWDLDMVARVRDRFPDTPFHIDCNSAYRLDAIDMFRALDDYALVMIEQPLAHDDLWDHAHLQAKLRTPICLDESINSPERARKALEMKACRWINIKPGRVGGITPALAIHEICKRANIPCWIGGMLESAVGQSFNVALSTLPMVYYACDVFPSERFYAADLGVPGIALSGPSQVMAFEGPGIGCTPHPERLEQLTIEAAVVE